MNGWYSGQCADLYGYTEWINEKGDMVLVTHASTEAVINNQYTDNTFVGKLIREVS